MPFLGQQPFRSDSDHKNISFTKVMFFELEFEPDGHRCVLKQIVVQDWKNDMHLHQTEWLGRARGNQQHR